MKSYVKFLVDLFHIEKVKELLIEDNQYTCDELAEFVSIRHESVNIILIRRATVCR